ncbi:hypothetical protein B0J11DRAFT_448573, partial [Dendryphion nanum]
PASSYLSLLTLQSRWWFASELCPLLAGTLGPLATCFTVCSLTEQWIYTDSRDENETQVQNQSNRSCVIVLKVLFLCSGLVSNGLSLIGRWTLSAFLVTAIGLFIQCFGLAGILIATRVLMKQRKTSEHSKFGQAYYYAIFSSGLSCITLLCVLLHGLGVIRKYYARRSKWGTIEKALFRQSVALTTYLLIGAIIFAHIEGWSFLNAVFWADFTLLTIGLGGEFTPKTALGRGLALPYAIFGVILAALLVISIRKLMNRGLVRVNIQLNERYLNDLQATFINDQGQMNPMINEHTFDLIRRITLMAETRCHRIALTVSIAAALLILLGGAAIFKIAEAHEGWTYGTSCYFAYTSLLTIGYGDYIPYSELGKSFFVLWSLLAVPTLTILINNSVDILYGAYRSLFRPFQRFFRVQDCQLKKAYQMETLTEGANTRTARTNIDALENRGTSSARQTLVMTNRIDSRFANLSDHAPQAPLHLHCFLLAQELRAAVIETNIEPSKKYTYNEWCYYIHLLGPFTKPQHPKKLEEASHDRKGKSRILVEKNKAFSFPLCMEQIEWVSRTSPLCGNEPEWVSMRLSSRLADLLRYMAAQNPTEN